MQDLTRNRNIKQMFTYISKHSVAWALILAILCVAFWIRIQGVDTIPEGQFTSNDAYFYYWNAQIISEQGYLPMRDMDRWVPIGRDLEQILSLYSYALAYTHKALSVLFPKLTLYQMTLYVPVVCFCIGIAAMCLFLYHTYGLLFASTFGILIATLPGTINRSTAGFCDRDSWCLMLGILVIVTYLASLQTQHHWKRLIFTLTSGVIAFLGGLSWEGFGVFLFILLFVELWRFLSSETDDDLKYYCFWVLSFVPLLFIVSPAYRRGEWFAQHLFAFMLVPPLVLLLIRYLRHVLMTKGSLAAKLRLHSRKLSLFLSAISLMVGILYVLIQSDTFALSTVPLSQNNLMQQVSELNDPEYRHWVFRYGSVFFLACIGLIHTSIHLWEKKSIILIPAIALFIGTTFFREQIDNFTGGTFGNTLFFVSIASAVLGILLIAWLRNKPVENELVWVTAAAYFLCWVALSRNAIRYDFFNGISIAFFSTVLIQYISDVLSTKLNLHRVWQISLKTCTTVFILTLLMWWTPAGAHAKRSTFSARHLRTAIPGNTNIAKSFRWMKSHLKDPKDTACVAGNWGHGSQLNVLGGVKTIIDQDHYIQYWIHLFYRHVYCAQSNSEALEFLKTHKTTHLMLTEQDLFQGAKIHSAIGSDAQGDRKFEFIPVQIDTYQNEKHTLVPNIQNPYVTHIYTSYSVGDESLITATTKLKNKREPVEIPHTIYIEKTRVHSQKPVGTDTGGIILFFNKHRQFKGGFYVSPVGWNSLAVRLFFRGESSETFVPVYPKEEFTDAEVKVWEIRYPPDIKSNPKYLETKSPE
jgi:hypothetical protein